MRCRVLMQGEFADKHRTDYCMGSRCNMVPPYAKYTIESLLKTLLGWY